jgi:hypothetical protein
VNKSFSFKSVNSPHTNNNLTVQFYVQNQKKMFQNLNGQKRRKSVKKRQKRTKIPKFILLTFSENNALEEGYATKDPKVQRG